MTMSMKNVFLVVTLGVLLQGCGQAPEVTCDPSAREALSVYGQPTENQMQALDNGEYVDGSLVYSQYGFTIQYSVAETGYCNVDTRITDVPTFCGICSNVNGKNLCNQFQAQTQPSC